MRFSEASCELLRIHGARFDVRRIERCADEDFHIVRYLERNTGVYGGEYIAIHVFLCFNEVNDNAAA